MLAAHNRPAQRRGDGRKAGHPAAVRLGILIVRVNRVTGWRYRTCPVFRVLGAIQAIAPVRLSPGSQGARCDRAHYTHAPTTRSPITLAPPDLRQITAVRQRPGASPPRRDKDAAARQGGRADRRRDSGEDVV